MRDDNLEMERFIGTDVLRSIFDEEKERPDVNSLFLSFPERWMNIVEERSLYGRLERFCPNLTKVQIKTQSVYIIQCTLNTCVKIVMSKEEEEQGTPLPQETDTGRLWFPNSYNLFVSGLNVVTPKGVRQVVP